MKPDWDALAKKYEGGNVVIGDVDCTVEDKLCSKVGVSGYPTIKYFTKKEPAGVAYDKGRDAASLESFVKKTLKGKVKSCDVVTKAECSAEEAKVLDEFAGKGGEVKAELAKLEKQLGGSEVLKADKRKGLEQRQKILKKLAKHVQKAEEL